MKTGIVFEGGAFRTIFSCGVMDALVENNIMPDYMIGVSAGAAYGVSMASRQPGRNLDVLIKYRNDKRYLSVGNMLDKENKAIYGLEFSYETIPNELNLFALPMLFPPIIINDTPYMDGGLTDSIPFMRALEDGCDRVLVVLTREAGYTKTTSTSTKAIARYYEKEYPKLSEVMLSRAERYNECLKQLKEYEDSGKVMVIRPAVSKGFSRLEKDKNKILSMYNDGYNQGYTLTGDIKKFFNYSNS